MIRVIVVVALLAAGLAPVNAQIYEWRDESGSRHFTNDVEDIPEAMRDDARVVVRVGRAEPADAEEMGPVAIAEEPAAESAEELPRRSRLARQRDRREEPEPVRQAQIVYDRPARFARPIQPAPPEVHINIEGPLAVSQVNVLPPQPEYFVDDRADVVYEPLVSTAFDRGRYRHRTVRMLLQDQFQYDRNGPPTLVRLPIPSGPRFQATLPRGIRSCSAPPRASVLRR